MKLFKEFVEESEIDEATLKSTMYGVVVKGKVIAKGSKAAMSKFAKQKGGSLLNSPAAKVGDSIVSKDGIRTLVKKEEIDEAKTNYTIVAIKNNKIVDQQHSIAKSEFKAAIKLFKKNNPGAKISIEDKGGKIVHQELNYPYGPLDTMRPMADLGDIPNYYGTKLNAQRKKKKVKRNV